MLIYGIWIDFVNLRSEKYAENSRIPTVVCTYSFSLFNLFFSPLMIIGCIVLLNIFGGSISAMSFFHILLPAYDN
jgi:hypothetical protein